MAIPPTVLVSSDISIETWVREEFLRFGRFGTSSGWPACGIEFVPKPIRLDALRRTIQLLLARPNPPTT
jgi:hypothetical protein